MCRNSDGEGGSLAYLAPNDDLTAVDGSDVLDNREAQSVSTVGPAARVVHAVETLEDPVNLGRRNADPVVGDCDLDVVIVASGLHMCSDDDARPRIGVGNGVLDKVSYRYPELAGAAHDPGAADTSDGQRNPVPLRIHPAAVDRLG